MIPARPCPRWFARPQLGIFIHWGVYSVPAFAPPGRSIHDLMVHEYDRACVLSPYAEWYENALRAPDSHTAAYHREKHAAKTYADFRAEFDMAASAFDAGDWAALFAAAGASYVVFVTKHHDGYCLWPTNVANPWRPGWNSTRDFVGELAKAVRALGMRFGVYYSGGLDWTAKPTPILNTADVFAAVPTTLEYQSYACAQVRELIERYRPSVLWNDIAWPTAANLDDLFKDYYTAVPDGVINDRWFAQTSFFDSLTDPRSRAQFNESLKAKIAAGEMFGGGPAFGDFRTVEYGLGKIPDDRKWEACRGLGLAFGYNAAEPEADYLTSDELIQLYRDVTTRGGNLLINVGPMADGTIPPLQAERLRALGAALR